MNSKTLSIVLCCKQNALAGRRSNKGVRAMFFVFCFALGVSTQVRSAVWTITYPQSEIENDVRYEYPLALLELALQKTSVRYQLVPSPNPMRQAKSLKRLEENLVINVMWSMTDNQREEQLLPIRIPIARGLIGWRMMMMRKGSAFANAPINNLQDLLAFTPVQGISWPDTKILQANGFNVETARDYSKSAELISSQGADFFPRSVVEILGELENEQSQVLELRSGLAIYYPTALYFFTNKRNLTLARLIETGLRRSMEDGSFDELFEQHFGEVLKQLDLENAQIFTLANPLLPILTPLGEPSYWFTNPQRTVD